MDGNSVHLKSGSRSFASLYSIEECLVAYGVGEGILSPIVAVKRIVEVLDVCDDINAQMRTVVPHFEQWFNLFIQKLVRPVYIPRLLVDMYLAEGDRGLHYTFLLAIAHEVR